MIKITREVKAVFDHLQELSKYKPKPKQSGSGSKRSNGGEDDPLQFAQTEFRRIGCQFPPLFHQWFLHSFANPTHWLEAKLLFSRSAALWSMVGHVVGLGDRHGENILIHTTSGECVHVDFDCLFDKVRA
jgi:hypothetical protein